MKRLAAYTVTGTVFDDYNENGTQDTREPGINGIIVTAYNSAGSVVATATTATVGGLLGQYTLSIASGTGAVRVQFTNYGPTSTSSQLVGYQPSNHTGGTPISFIDGTQATNTVNLGLEHPEEYCQNNPSIVTSCYIVGAQATATDHVMVSFPYNSSGATTAPTALANAPDVGSTWGLAYRRSSDNLFAAAYMKRHSGFKPGGSTGAIYLINSVSTTPVVSSTPFIDLNALFGTTTAGTNPHDTANYPVDTAGYDPVGKISLGGLAISADQSTLYTMNLADKKLYSIPIGSPPAVPTAPTAAAITRTTVPQPTDCSVANDFRPFAVTYYREHVYVGAVCSAESTVTGSLPLGDPTAMHAYVFVYTPGSGFTTTPAFETGLNYTRHCAYNANASNCTSAGVSNMTTGFPAAWNPWHPTFTGYQDTYEANIVYPQPMLTGITFDNGDMLLGLRDRFGDQTGYRLQDNPSNTARSNIGVTAGDTLRACLNTPGSLASGWTLENNALCGSIQPGGKNNGKGPGNGQYYSQDQYTPFHDYVSIGSLLQIPGQAGVMETAFDPITGGTTETGGVRTFNNVTSSIISSYQIYDSNTNGNTYGKANGLGSLAALCQSAPIEVGHRVWEDINGNGIQDASEPGIAGVTVDLYASDGTTLLNTTTTDSIGAYYFTISPYTSYVVKLDHVSDYSTGPLNNYHLSSANQDTLHMIDSKATLPTPASAIGTNNYPQATIGSHTPGQNDTSFDIGLVPPPDLTLTKTVPSATTFQAGKSVTYTLTPSASSSAGPVLAGNAITITDTIPAGLIGLSASAVTSSDWTLSLAGTVSPTTLTATYKGTYPVASGATLSAITLTGTLTTAALAPTPAPAGYWAFNENSGTTAYDYSSNHNNGTLTGSPIWVPGAVNSGLSFNGSSNYVTMGNLSALQFGTGSFTALASFKTTSTSGYTRLFNQGVGSWNGGFNIGMNAFCSGCVSVSLGGGGGGTTSTVVGTSTNFADGKWHQAAMVIDGTAKTVQLYIDGVAQTISVQGSTCGTSSTSTTVTIPSSCGSSITANTTDPFVVGAYTGASGTFQYFNGSLDEVRVYGSALTSSQIQNLYTTSSLTNTATISTPNDSNAANNTATSTITVVPQPDLSLTKTVKTNLAFKETVTSNNSYETSDWGVTRLTDGITTSITGSKGYTSNGFNTSDASSSPPYVDIDLGTDQTFSSVVLYPRTDTLATDGSTASFPINFTIQGASNGSSTYTTIDTITNQANPNGSPQTYSFSSTTARHVRVVVTTLGKQASGDGYYRFQLAEMQVY